jgi:predicted alpha-1,2-mannosidase
MGFDSRPNRRGFIQSLLAAATLGSSGVQTVVHAEPSQADSQSPPRSSVDYVNPHIGGIGHLLTSVYPEVQLPHGMMVVAPWFAPDVTDVYLATEVKGFSVGNSIIMGVSGNETSSPLNAASDWDHDRDTVAPYYSLYNLESYGITIEYTVAERSAHFRFNMPTDAPGQIILRPQQTATYTLTGAQTIAGVEENQGVTTYLRVEFSRPPSSHNISKIPTPTGSAQPQTEAIVLGFEKDSGTVEARVSFSYLGADQAERTLSKQLPVNGFERTKLNARATWDKALACVGVEGGTEDQRTIFYTALYRSLQYMKNVTEDGRYLGPFDRKVHETGGRDFYIEDNLWDTYRTRHPLSILIEPERHEDMVRSYLRMYEESGWMPQFPFMRGDLLFMSGNHAASMVLDAYVKGQRNFDLALAYEGLKKDATEATMLPYRRGGLTDLDRFYAKNGYFPALRKGEKETESRVDPDMRRQAVSVTLDAAYDDWCLSQIAKLLSRVDDAAYFGSRALNYRKLFNPATGFMAPRGENGEFIPEFDPKWSGGQAGRDYFTECNGLVYSFDVQHDVSGLIDLMGGRDQFVGRLDSLFAEGYNGELKFKFLAQFPDSTALVGQYPQGNEPSFHIPYLYNYAGAPWKTQKRVRQIMQIWYSAHPLGLPGDDDNGATTSWYVFSAMGFYPICPGRAVYTIGSPLFRKATIAVRGGKTFTVVADRTSVINKYIQSARLNGQKLDRAWFEHADVMRGGELVLEMGPFPNKSWGAEPCDALPPFSQ